MKKKIIRITTVPISLSGLLEGQLRFMSQYFDVLGVSSIGKDNQLLRVSELEGIPIKRIDMTRKITPLKDAHALWQLYRLFKTEKPYIVHSHTPKAGTLSMLAAKLAGVPHRLHTIAGLPLMEAKGFKRILLNTVEKLTYACATKIYPNSYGLESFILDSKFTSKKKLKIIANGSSNGIDTNKFNPNLYKNTEENNKLREKINIDEEDFVFVFIGRLVADKGVNELIEAFSKLCETHKKIKLLLVGIYENELDPLKQETLDSIKTNKNIVSVGWVNDVRPYLAISNVLAFPSYREGFPNVVMQGAAMELTCIVTNINGCNEIIKHNETGIIIPVKDKHALYNAMHFVLNNKTLGKEMGLQSRLFIKQNFERYMVWQALLKEYQDLK